MRDDVDKDRHCTAKDVDQWVSDDQLDDLEFHVTSHVGESDDLVYPLHEILIDLLPALVDLQQSGEGG